MSCDRLISTQNWGFTPNIRQQICPHRNKLSKYGRNTDGTFSNGNIGKPKGARNKKTIAFESLLECQAEALTQTAISKALKGDGLALHLSSERIAPAPKDNSVSFPLPEMKDAMDASKAASNVLTAVSKGNLLQLKEHASWDLSIASDSLWSWLR